MIHVFKSDMEGPLIVKYGDVQVKISEPLYDIVMSKNLPDPWPVIETIATCYHLNWTSGIDGCAKAASKSYGKDLSAEPDVDAYVKRIWDRHTNVSEHFVFSLDINHIPRIVTMIMAFQRYGFSMTEFSQRRRKPEVVTEDYDDSIKPEEARKVLPWTTPTQATITLNREAARNIVRILNKYREYRLFTDVIDKTCFVDMLAYYGMFEPDHEAPFDCPDFDGFISAPEEAKEPRTWPLSADYQYGREVVCPCYSMHQLIRHRTLHLLRWGILSEEIPLDKLTMQQPLCMTLESFLLWKFIDQRSTRATQEPLRAIAQNMMR